MVDSLDPDVNEEREGEGWVEGWAEDGDVVFGSMDREVEELEGKQRSLEELVNCFKIPRLDLKVEHGFEGSSRSCQDGGEDEESAVEPFGCSFSSEGLQVG